MELERIGNGEDDDGGVIFTESKYEYLRPYVARVAERARDLGRWYAETGAVLREAKDACKRGHWLPFLKTVGIEERTAQRMMQIAQGVGDDPELLEAHKTVRGLLAATAPKSTAPNAPKAKASKSKPSEPQPEAPEQSDTVSGYCAHCHAPADWRDLVAAEDWTALQAAAAVAEAEAA